MGLITGRQSAEADVAEHADKAHGLIDKIVSAVKHVHEEHVQREHTREEHQFEEIQHLAEHNHDVDRENLPF